MLDARFTMVEDNFNVYGGILNVVFGKLWIVNEF